MIRTVFLLILTGLGSIWAVEGNSTTPLIQEGPQLQIDIVRRNSSELDRTLLFRPQILSFTGTIPFAPISGVSGEIVPFSPPDGCQALEFDPKYHVKRPSGEIYFKSFGNSSASNVVILMQKSTKCGFSQMFQEASRIPHVVGILIYDPIDNLLDKDEVELAGEKIHLPGFLISKSLGEELMKKINKYREGFNNNSSQNADATWVQATLMYIPTKADVSRASQIMFGIILMVLIVSLVSAIAFNRTLPSNPPGSSDIPPPPPSRRPEDIEINAEFIEKLPVRFYRSLNSSPVEARSTRNVEKTAGTGTGKEALQQCSEDSGHEDEDFRRRQAVNETCPVCIEEFKYGTMVKQLHCGHCYHPHCITPWLTSRSPLCPLCKIDVRVSMIEAEELAFVRKLRRRDNQRNVLRAGEETEPSNKSRDDGTGCEMKEVCIVSPTLKARQASFDSISLEPGKGPTSPPRSPGAQA